MKRKLIFLLLLAWVLALTPVALAEVAQASARAERPALSLDAQVLSGGRYQLASTAGQVSNGGSYYLVGPAMPKLTGNGCCCTYLPCAIR